MGAYVLLAVDQGRWQLTYSDLYDPSTCRRMTRSRRRAVPFLIIVACISVIELPTSLYRWPCTADALQQERGDP